MENGLGQVRLRCALNTAFTRAVPQRTHFYPSQELKTERWRTKSVQAALKLHQQRFTLTKKFYSTQILCKKNRLRSEFPKSWGIRITAFASVGGERIRAENERLVFFCLYSTICVQYSSDSQRKRPRQSAKSHTVNQLCYGVDLQDSCFILVCSRSVCCLFHPFSAVATTHLLDGGAVAFEIVSFKRLETATRIKNLENADSGTEDGND